MPGIRIGTVEGKPKQLSQKTINNIYHGRVLIDDWPHTAYIKDVGANEVFIEYLAAELGLKLGLDIALPVWTYWDGKLVFSSVDAEASSFKTLCCDPENMDYLKHAFCNWKQLNLAACFDEWINNYDRNNSNFLIDWEGKVVLIDHGLAMQKPKEHPTKTNGFLNAGKAINTANNELSKRRYCNELNKAASVIDADLVQQLTNPLVHMRLISPSVQKDVTEYLHYRLQQLIPFFHVHLNMKQQTLALN